MAALPKTGMPAGNLQPVEAAADNVMSYMFWLEPGVASSNVPLMLQPLSVPLTVPSDPTINDAPDVAQVPDTLACVTASAFSALYVHAKFEAVPPRLRLPDNVCFALSVPVLLPILVVNPVMTLKLVPELIDHAFPVTARLVKSDDIGIDPVTLSVVRLLCGSTNAIVVLGSVPVDTDQIPVGSFADAAVEPV